MSETIKIKVEANRSTRRNSEVSKKVKDKYKDDITDNVKLIPHTPHRSVKKLLKESMFGINLKSSRNFELIKHLKEIHSKQSTSKSKLTIPFEGDLTSDSVKEIYKNYDLPKRADDIVLKLENRLFIVRPPEQTLAERQTGAYQQTQLFDTLDGNILPTAHIVIRIDKAFNGVMYCYDGQHGTLTSKDAEKKIFFLDDTLDIINTKEAESYDYSYAPIWSEVKKFSEQHNKETFTLKDLCAFSDIIKEAVESSEKRVLVGQLHFTDGQGASQLIRKLNEHLSSHSNPQRAKSECNGFPINDVLYDREYSLMESYIDDDGSVKFTENSYTLSEIVPKIPFFNQSHSNTFPSGTLPKTFSYNRRSKNYKEMNYDQYLVYFYNTLISFIEQDTKKGVYAFKKPSLNINSLRNNNSNLSGDKYWKTYGIEPDVVNGWVSIFKSLEYESLDNLQNVVQDMIHIANHATSSTFKSKLSKLNKLIKDWAGEFKESADKILKNANVTDIDSLTDTKKSEYQSLIGKQERLEKLLFKTHHQFVNLTRLAIQTKPSTQPITNWIEGIIDVMCANFKPYYEDNLDLFLAGFSGTLHRFNKIDEVFLKKAFVDRVKDETTSSDTSLWSRSEARKYITDILDFEGTTLYYCPYNKDFVTTENFESHHLAFRSKNPKKEFSYWFPLSSKYNGYISDDGEKNIVNDGGNFIDACKTMIAKSEHEIGLTNDDDLIEKYKDNIDAFKKWIRKANRYLDKSLKVS